MSSGSAQETTSSGKWAQAGVPHKGWRCVDIEELEQQEHLCEMCEARLVRFVHVMENDRFDGALRVGCVCAGHMEGDIEGARSREASFKNSRSRRSRWLSRSWRTSAAGNPYLNTNDGFNVVVYRQGAAWGARVEHRTSGFSRSSRQRHSTADAAKLAAFDAMVGMKHAEPWRAQHSSEKVRI